MYSFIHNSFSETACPCSYVLQLPARLHVTKSLLYYVRISTGKNCSFTKVTLDLKPLQPWFSIVHPQVDPYFLVNIPMLSIHQFLAISVLLQLAMLEKKRKATSLDNGLSPPNLPGHHEVKLEGRKGACINCSLQKSIRVYS